MSSLYSQRGKVSRLIPADVEASSKSAYANMERKALEEWPNDAGFDGLTEHRGPVELRVMGSIPAWASGSLYRTGPGVCTVESPKSASGDGKFYVSHWFDGLGHTHRFDIIADGPGVRVYYSSRRQADKVAADILAKGTLRSITFGQRRDPCVGIFGKFMSIFDRGPQPPNVAVTVNVNVAGLPSSTLRAPAVDGHRAVSVLLGTDASVFCEVDPKTLEPLAFPTHSAFHPDLKGPLGGAHGKIDPQTGDYINYNLDFGKQSTWRVFRVHADSGKTEILATINHRAAFVHSFFMTQNYVILCTPVAYYQWNGLKIPWEGNLHDSFKPFDSKESCRWFVVDLRGGKGVVAEFASPARFFFHTVNAFEDEAGDVFCEVADYPNRNIVDAFYYDVILNRDGKGAQFWSESQKKHRCFPRVVRFRLPKASFATGPAIAGAAAPAPEVVAEVPSPHAGDLPVINPLYRGRPHRFGYFLVSRALSTIFDAISKIDMETGEVLQWEGPHGHTPGEAIFVAHPAADGEARDEDDGVLLSVVLDGIKRTSYLLCLDAKTMTELGSADCDFAVAIGLHGRHVGAAT